MTDDDRIPASFVWTGDDGPDDQQRVPEGPALGNYPAIQGHIVKFPKGTLFPPDTDTPERRATVGEKIARFLEDLAEKVRGIH